MQAGMSCQMGSLVQGEILKEVFVHVQSICPLPPPPLTPPPLSQRDLVQNWQSISSEATKPFHFTRRKEVPNAMTNGLGPVWKLIYLDSASPF